MTKVNIQVTLRKVEPLIIPIQHYPDCKLKMLPINILLLRHQEILDF